MAQQFMNMRHFDGIIFTLFSLATLTTFLRLLARQVVLRAVGLDDALATAGTLTGALLGAFQHYKMSALADTYMNFTRNPKYTSTPAGSYKFGEVVKWTTLAGLFYIITLGLVKVSILAFYRRMAVTKAHRIAIYIPAAVIIAYSMANCIASIFKLEPTSASFNPRVKRIRTRFDVETLTLVNSAIQAAFDVVILLLPIPILIKLQTNRRDKAALIGVYCLGFFSLATTIVRLTQSIDFESTAGLRAGLLKQPIFTAWTSAEVNTGIMCANLPAISSLLRCFGRRKTNASPSYEKDRGGWTPPARYGSSDTPFFRKGAPVSSISCSGKSTGHGDSDLEASSGINRTTELHMDIEAGVIREQSV